jgi:hypothetical protein
MDFKNILSQLTQLSEATKETEKGRIHKAEPGGYGRKFDTDEEGEEKQDKKPKADAPKRGRGRPKKGADDSGEVKKYDNAKSLQSYIVGNIPKKTKELEKLPKKKHSLKEWVQEIENKYVAEAIPPGMKPLAVLDPANKQVGAGVLTSKNPSVQKMLGSIDPKDVQIVQTTAQTSTQPAAGATGQAPTGTQPMKEKEGDYSAKKARAGKDIGKPGKQFSKIAKSAGERYGSKAAGERVAGAVLKNLRKADEGVSEASKKIPASNKPVKPEDLYVSLKDIPAKKPRGHTQYDPAKEFPGVKAFKKQGVAEADIPSDQMDMGAGLGAGRSDKTFEGKKAKPDFLDIDKDKNKKESMKKAASDKKKKKVTESSHRHSAARLMGKSHALAKEGYNCRYEDMDEAREYHEGFKEGLDECYGQVPIRGTVVGEMDIPSTVPGMADQAMEDEMMEVGRGEYMKQKARSTPGDTFKAFGQTMHDKDVLETSMFESWDKELNGLLTEYDTIQEGLTVSISKGQQGAPDSVSVTAQDAEADQLLQLVKSAGLGLFGGDDQQSSMASVNPMTVDTDSKEGDIDVVGDHDGMMALIKKVTGGAGEPDTVAIGGDDHDHGDYEDEEGHDHKHTDEATCNECGMEESKCGCEEGKEMVDEVESEDQMAYEVAEDNQPDSGAEETAAEDEEIAKDNAAASSHGGANMEESEKLDEWANEAGQKGTDASFETDIAFMTKVIAGGLNKEKSTGQTTVPVIAGQKDRMGYSITNESINDWKKLAGLK